MLKRYSLLYPMLLLLGVTLFSTLAAGYLINYPFLHQSLRENLEVHARNTVEELRLRMDQDLRRLAFNLHSLPRWNGALTAAMTRLAEKEGSTLDPFRKDLEQLGYLLEVDSLVLLGNDNRVLFSNVPQVPERGHYAATELEEVMRNAGGLTTVNAWGQWHVMGAARLGEGDPPAIRVLAGIQIGKRFARMIQQRHSSGLVFIASGGEPVGGAGLENWLPVDENRYNQVLRDERPMISLDEGRSQGWYYAPISLMEEHFCLALPVTPAAFVQTMKESLARLGWTSLVIAVFITLLGLGLHFLFLIPLRGLKEKALVMVETCAGKDELELDPVARNTGSELVVLGEAFEAASRTLYAHIGHLMSQKETFEKLARNDPLTGLGNRRQLGDVLEKSVAQHRRKDRQLALLYLDLDRFKEVNDTHGHDMGDLLLQEVARRIGLCLREADTAFRLGGDEFAALLPECTGAHHAVMVAERIRKEMNRPFELKGQTCHVGASIGIALFPDHGQHYDELLKMADNALYDVKRSGRNAVRVYGNLGNVPFQEGNTPAI